MKAVPFWRLTWTSSSSISTVQNRPVGGKCVGVYFQSDAKRRLGTHTRANAAQAFAGNGLVKV